ncbi:hypothetical protein H7J86_05505 [Mycobacterium hackensackense]|uniref:hypothetical protein n=1 Tax=Mycobacterium hackensackense TaxID=228909 RepID=UPI002265F2C2|nr:hypothetical protein [Mycobacterium hackensackense]MCV7251612.1 hypothetical protein [Mycobacterium hackensackense]
MCCGEIDAASLGPEVDAEFFAGIRKVFDEFPDAKKKYSIDALPTEAEVAKIGVDLDGYVGVTRYEPGRVITEFYPRDNLDPRRVFCCKWDGDNRCLKMCGHQEL